MTASAPSWPSLARRALASEKVRFIVAGLWNSLFGWLAFAVLWAALGGRLNLWAISALAHLAATTQSFYVQRRLVFRAQGGSLAAQYLKFQLSYLVLLAIGAFAVNALEAQQVHPLVGQFFAIALLAVCGYLFGRNFTFSDASLSGRAALARIAQAVRAHRLALAVFALSMPLLEAARGAPFYERTLAGLDFTLAAPALIEGKYWLDANGLMAGLFNPPWFTPAWCAGTAFFAEPQSVFYSPLQLFALFVNPFAAAHLNMLLFGAVAFWGCYALARTVFGWTAAGAVVFAVLGICNGMQPLRGAIGQVSYVHLYLWAPIVTALCWRAAPGASRVPWPSVCVALCLTGWVQFGYVGMMVPTYLGVLLLCMVLVLAGKARLAPVVTRTALGGAIAVALNGAKLYEGISLMRNFPRDFYAPFGYGSFADALQSIAWSLVLPTDRSVFFATRSVSDAVDWAFPVEWALHFGIGALAAAWLACAALLVLAGRRQADGRSGWPRRLQWAALAAIAVFYAMAYSTALGNAVWSVLDVVTDPIPGAVWLLAALAASAAWLYRRKAWFARRPRAAEWWVAAGIALAIALVPLLLLGPDGAARQFIKRVPLLSSTTWTMRWTVVYLPLAQLLLAWPVIRLLRAAGARRAALLSFAAGALVWLGPLTEPMDYYLDPVVQKYDARPAVRAFEASRQAGAPPPIHTVGVRWGLPPEGNDTMFEGVSNAKCFNPLYGYKLEGLTLLERFVDGPPLARDDQGRTMLANPACLLHPRENACEPGAGFAADDPHQVEQAKRLLARKPIDWERPLAGRVLAVVSQLMFWMLLTLLAVRLWHLLFALARPPAPTPKESP